MFNIFKSPKSKTKAKEELEMPIQTYKMHDAFVSQESYSPVSESSTLFSDSSLSSISTKNSFIRPEFNRIRVGNAEFWDEPNSLNSDPVFPKNQFEIPLASTHDEEFERMLQELNEPIRKSFARERSDRIQNHKLLLLQEAKMEKQRQKDYSDSVSNSRAMEDLESRIEKQHQNILHSRQEESFHNRKSQPKMIGNLQELRVQESNVKRASNLTENKVRIAPPVLRGRNGSFSTVNDSFASREALFHSKNEKSIYMEDSKNQRLASVSVDNSEMNIPEKRAVEKAVKHSKDMLEKLNKFL